MLSNVNQTINLTAGSFVDGNVVLLMSANIRTGEAPAINKAYKDLDAYQKNKEQVDADFSTFEAKVFEVAGQA